MAVKHLAVVASLLLGACTMGLNADLSPEVGMDWGEAGQVDSGQQART